LEWDRTALLHPQATIFHTGAWAKVLCKTYGHHPVYVRWSERGKPVALMPMMEVRSPLTGRRGVCLPFTDFCEPLVFGGVNAGQLVDKLLALARERRWKFFEVRGRGILEPWAVPSTTFYGHSLDLRGGIDKIFDRLASSTRRAIRKAGRSGLMVEISRSLPAVRDFYRLHGRTRRRHGLPPQPWSFFANIHAEIIREGAGFAIVARNGSRAVAAALFFGSGKNAVYKFGASDQSLQALRANNLVMWEAIKSLAGDGFDTLHLGRTSLSNDGLRRYKSNWGTQQERIDYFRFDTRTGACVNARDNASGFHNKVFARLPLALNRLMGAVIYPHLD
jgi:CelD/BcsL family acetyltransferase involved in cellulose biosynthesis